MNDTIAPLLCYWEYWLTMMVSQIVSQPVSRGILLHHPVNQSHQLKITAQVEFLHQQIFMGKNSFITCFKLIRDLPYR